MTTVDLNANEIVMGGDVASITPETVTYRYMGKEFTFELDE
jgi:hypothetical protein